MNGTNTRYDRTTLAEKNHSAQLDSHLFIFSENGTFS